jgi:hypothetical protein
MRRARAIPLALALLIFVAAPVSAGGKPDRFHDPALPLELPGGPDGICDFDVRLENLVDRIVVKVFPPNRAGAVRITLTGAVLARVTNLESGAWRDFRNNASVTIWEYPDGSASATFSGPVFAFYFAADEAVSSLDQGLWYVRGHGGEIYGSDGSLLSATAVGSIQDVCAMLAG